jgi:nucleoside-diphosphate-sugar epimerase
MYKIKGKKILITGAAFIGVHLVKRLIKEQAASITISNRTSKHKDNLKKWINEICFIKKDLRNFADAKKIVRGHDIVFHLAADHGGRGYVDTKQGNTTSNLLLDGSIFKACLDCNVEKVFYASSGCVYPNFAQRNIHKKLFLRESDVVPPYDADNMYGWAKLMGELTLRQYHNNFGLNASIGRFFTVYGPYASESHAVMGTIAKAFIKQDPFEVWGSGSQIRNWTYVDDIISGIVEIVKKTSDATPINLGTKERITVDQMVGMTLQYFQYSPSIRHIKMPTGPMNRVADISRAKKILRWTPKVMFIKGLEKTINWYIQNKNQEYIKTHLPKLLIHD